MMQMQQGGYGGGMNPMMQQSPYPMNSREYKKQLKEEMKQVKDYQKYISGIIGTKKKKTRN